MFILLAGIAHRKRVNMSALGIGVDFLQVCASVRMSISHSLSDFITERFALCSGRTPPRIDHVNLYVVQLQVAIQLG